MADDIQIFKNEEFRIEADFVGVNDAASAAQSAAEAAASAASFSPTLFVGVAGDRVELAAMSGETYLAVDLLEPGRKGTFHFDNSDLSAKVTLDTQQGFYVPPTTDTTGASGCWVRGGDWEAIGGDPRWSGAVDDGATDSTAAFQNTLRVCPKLRIPRTVTGFSVGEVDVTDSQIVQGAGTRLSEIIRKTGSRWTFRTTNVRGSVATNATLYPRFRDFMIEYNGGTGVGILLEGSWYGECHGVLVDNVVNGSWSYTDGGIDTDSADAPYGSQSYDSAGCMVKGIAGVIGAYYNNFFSCVAAGVDSSTLGRAGFVATSTTATSNQKANSTAFWHCRGTFCLRNFSILNGNDCKLYSPEASAGTTGIYTTSIRTRIYDPYLEGLTNGVRTQTGGDECWIYGVASTSGTTTVFDDQVGNGRHSDDSYVGITRYTAVTAAAGDTTPSVKAATAVQLSNPSATSITNFDDGGSGQKIIVYATTANSTLKHTSGGGNFTTKSGADVTLAANGTIEFLMMGGVWREI